MLPVWRRKRPASPGNSTGGCSGVRIMKLTVNSIAKLTAPGRYFDQHGLYLQVQRAKNRSWLLRYETGGRERWAGLGPLHTVSLKEARARARKARLQLLDGIDPIEQRICSRGALSKMPLELQDLRWAIVARQHRSIRQTAEALSVRQSTLKDGANQARGTYVRCRPWRTSQTFLFGILHSMTTCCSATTG